MSRDVETTLAERVFTRFMTQHGDAQLPDDHKYVQEVKQVAAQLIASSGVPSIKDLNWTFHVIDNPHPTAFAVPGAFLLVNDDIDHCSVLAANWQLKQNNDQCRHSPRGLLMSLGGRICINSGLFRLTEDRDGLAFVLAHEIAHVIARKMEQRESISQYSGHSAEHYSAARFWLVADDVFSRLGMTSVSDRIRRNVLGSSLSRDCEMEADYIGILLAAKACFDVTKAPAVLERLYSHEGTKSSGYNSHPTFDQRTKTMKEYIPRAVEETAHCAVSGCVRR